MNSDLHVPVQPPKRDLQRGRLRMGRWAAMKSWQRFVWVAVLCCVLIAPLVWLGLYGQVVAEPRIQYSEEVGGIAQKHRYQALDVHDFASVQIDGESYAVQPYWLLQNLSRAPSMRQQTEVLETERLLFQAVKSGSDVAFVHASGESVPVHFREARWTDKNFTFWLHVGLSWMLLSAALWVLVVLRRDQTKGNTQNLKPAMMMLLFAVFYALTLLLSVSQMQRVWAVDPAVLRWRYHLSHFSSYLCLWIVLWLMWHVPTKIGATAGAENRSARHSDGQSSSIWGNSLYAVLALLILARLGEYFYWWKHFAVMEVVCASVVGVGLIIGGVMQWRAVRQYPMQHLLDRVALSWVLWVLLALAAVGVSMNATFAFYPEQKQEGNITMSMMLGLFALALAMVLMRNQLQRIQTIWMHPMALCAWAYGLMVGVWAWAIREDSPYSLEGFFVGLTLGGACFLACVWWLFRAQTKRHRSLISTMGPLLLSPEVQALSEEQQQTYLEYLLKQWARPVSLRRTDPLPPIQSGEVPTSHAVSDMGGVKMDLVGVTHDVELWGYKNGTQLFSATDSSQLVAISQMARQGMLLRHSHQWGKDVERRRIARDLQDSIGKKLLNLTKGEGDYAAYARKAWQDLLLLTNGLEAGERPVPEMLADIRHTLQTMCESQKVALDLHIVQPGDSTHIHSDVSSQMNSICIELMRNALQHEDVSRVQMHLELSDHVFDLTVENDGAVTDTALWKEGVGLVSMRRRLYDLGGTIQWTALPIGGVRCHVNCPMQQWLSSLN